MSSHSFMPVPLSVPLAFERLSLAHASGKALGIFGRGLCIMKRTIRKIFPIGIPWYFSSWLAIGGMGHDRIRGRYTRGARNHRFFDLILFFYTLLAQNKSSVVAFDMKSWCVAHDFYFMGSFEWFPKFLNEARLVKCLTCL